MPTFREDLHLGHKVPTVETDDLTNKSVTGDKIADRVIDWFHILAKVIRNEHIDDEAVDNRTLADNAVDTRNLRGGSVTPSKVSSDFVDTLVAPLIDALRRKHDTDVDSLKAKDKDLQNQIDSINVHGVSVSNVFGTNPHISISQKTMTDAINKLWQKLEDMTGEVLQGINMVVWPTYFISEDGCDIHISANTVETNGIFENIQFFVDGENIYDGTNKEYVEPFIYHLDNKATYDYVVMCKAKILGIEYTRQQVITRYNEFYIGAGTTYDDIMNAAHAKQLNGRMRHAYDVTFEDDDKLIIVMGASMRERFIRADLNGAEIEMTEVKLDAEGHVIPEEDTTTEVKFIGFMSEPWSAGDYNIDING